MGFWRAACYFFMLPTVCFPLFPVVDYMTMWRTWVTGREGLRVHQTGAEWILRGLVQLLLYRLVYHSLSVDAAGVETASQALLYLVRPYLLYLRISGSFHLVIGIMHLYGFDLPRTSHNYFLASSFTDYWRRINIYWKDFMMKVVYYPTFFQLRRFGPTTALVLATSAVFVATTVLHSYQWFWLRGDLPFPLQDMLFWSILAVLVIVNAVWEARRGRKRALGVARRTPGERLGLAARTGLTFTVIVSLWSLWTSTSVTEWLAMWTVLGRNFAIGPGAGAALAVVGLAMETAGRGTSGQAMSDRRGGGAGLRGRWGKADKSGAR